MKSKSTTLLALVSTVTMICSMTAAYGADPLYQWNFNSGDGSNTGTGTAGTLTENLSAGATTGSFSGTGVTGIAGDNSLFTSNANTSGSGIGDAATLGDVDLPDLSRFTVTMWIKQTAGSWGNTATLLNIGATTAPDGSSNPGISLGISPLWQNGVTIGVNGRSEWTGSLGISDGSWHFVAFAYNGNNGAYWGQEDMIALYGGGQNNARIITGSASAAASVAAEKGVHDGGYWNSAGLPSVGTTATAFLGNNGPGTSGFTGNLDDVRVYNSLLTVAEIEAIRLSAFAEPTPTVDLYWKGDAGTSWAALNWTSDSSGNVSGGALATDGSDAVAFATTGAANLSNVLGADQNVRSIVVTTDLGPVDIGGTHSLTLGADGLWVDLAAAGLSINTTGGVILGENQTWKNKSSNSLTVNSTISGSGTLTKSGTGPLRLGGDNLHTGGTVVDQGTLALDHANALGGASASLAMNGGTLDLNGRNVILGALTGTSVGIIYNTSASPCTLTMDTSAADSAYACKINDGPGGPVSLVKKGSFNLTSSNGSTSGFTGPVTIEGGQFIANHANYGGAPTTSSLGNLQVPGRTITVTSPGSLRLTNNNIFGNQNADASLLPEIIANAAIVSSTNYNLIGDIALNAATLTQSTGTGNYQGYQFRGIVKALKDVVAPAPSQITATGSGGNHLSANTIFYVEDVDNGSGVDLTVSAPLLDRSGDFGSGRGGFTKTGAGTMLLSGASTYTGNTEVSEGTLALANPTLSDIRTIKVAAGAKISLDFPVENNTDIVGSLVLDGVTKPVGTYGALGSGAGEGFESAMITGPGFIEVIGLPDPFGDWIATFPSLSGPDAARGADPDFDGLTNIQEFAFNSIPNDGAASRKSRASVETINSEQALVLTIPVRNGATFVGNAPAIATVDDDQLDYRIEGTNDLAIFNQQVSEVTPAVSDELLEPDFGWTRRSFRLNGNVGGSNPRGPSGFLRAVVIDTK